ncbi:HAD-IA family hydrolase [Pelagovum pacificum]|uniref:HAD-IA family hydrolase n=1 Tax=Pelagovum pacificum TaxID=2588711 RepID=A0A5C5GIY3_9RHOB|nr:HAD-IA family hydrolase [Pelagovum pacificum]QQA42675.1 HAD-IA family hydrolase [Pelagovum pacificum]TNY34174.1 HAD-IA family hydrolase [Pelagovum pacificum]
MSVNAVIFDIGNVLIEWNPERYFDRAVGEARRREMFEALDLHGMNDKVDMGQNFTDTVTAFAEENPAFAEEIMLWHDNWIEMASPAIDHSVRLLRALRRRKVPVFALSNFGVQTFEIGELHYPFLEEFDKRFISGHMGVIKPDPRIYEMVEEDAGFAPGTLLFTDDRPDNIAAARARDWQVHLFDGPAGLAARLVEERLLTEGEAA